MSETSSSTSIVVTNSTNVTRGSGQSYNFEPHTVRGRAERWAVMDLTREEYTELLRFMTDDSIPVNSGELIKD